LSNLQNGKGFEQFGKRRNYAILASTGRLKFFKNITTKVLHRLPRESMPAHALSFWEKKYEKDKVEYFAMWLRN